MKTGNVAQEARIISKIKKFEPENPRLLFTTYSPQPEMIRPRTAVDVAEVPKHSSGKLDIIS